MRFPQLELNIDQYMQIIKDLLIIEDCHLFIDTNIISQLYKLNDDARADFFSWVTTVSGRFHIPNWVVHEYQKRYVGQKTKDYLTELNNGDVVKRLKNLSTFAKGYIGDSLLIGSIYQGKKDELFTDLDEVADKFEKIHKAITKKLTEHQLNVHKDILQNLQQYTMPTDVYSIIEDLASAGELRYNHLVPPGYGDDEKELNRFGDLIIWREILGYCKENNIKKAIWITRDAKPDMAYTPQRQLSGDNQVDDKLDIAHESLVYEFSKTTESEVFYIINFMTLVKCLSSNYQKLAISFQIVTTPEQSANRDPEENPVITEDSPSNTDEIQSGSEQPVTPEPQSFLYSQKALADMGCEDWCDDPQVNLIIKNLKSYNWYKQNDAIQILLREKLTIDPTTLIGRDMVFVLGRNIYQSAVGAAHEAINYLQNLNVNINNWDKRVKKALTDGMLYEVFFNSKGEIRPREFKANYYDLLLKQIDLLGLDNPYEFINTSLSAHSSVRFAPEVHTEKEYLFEFEYDIGKFGQALVKVLKINGLDVSPTFTQSFRHDFAGRDELVEKLSKYYAILPEYVKIADLDTEVTSVSFIGEHDIFGL